MHFFIHVVSIWIIWYDSFKWLLIQHRSVKISFWFSSFWGNVDSRLNLKMITWLILFDSDSWMITNKWLQLIDHKPTLLANRFVTSNRLPEAPALTEYNTAACSISMKLNLFYFINAIELINFINTKIIVHSIPSRLLIGWQATSQNRLIIKRCSSVWVIFQCWWNRSTRARQMSQ